MKSSFSMNKLPDHRNHTKYTSPINYVILMFVAGVAKGSCIITFFMVN